MSDTKDEAADVLAVAQAKNAKLTELLEKRTEITASFVSEVAVVDAEITNLIDEGAVAPTGKRGRGRPKGSGKGKRGRPAKKHGKVGRPAKKGKRGRPAKKGKRGRPAKTGTGKRGRPPLTAAQKAERAAAKSAKSGTGKRGRGRPKGSTNKTKKAKVAKTGTGKRGRPPLTEAQKAERAAAKPVKTGTGKRGRPPLSPDEKARRAAERQEVERQTDMAQESVDSTGQNGDVPPEIETPAATGTADTDSTDTE